MDLPLWKIWLLNNNKSMIYSLFPFLVLRLLDIKQFDVVFHLNKYQDRIISKDIISKPFEFGSNPFPCSSLDGINFAKSSANSGRT